MINVRDDGKIADVCAVHEDGLKLYFSIQRSAVSTQPRLFTAKGAKYAKENRGVFELGKSGRKVTHPIKEPDI